MKTRNLHKIVTFLIACLILACCLVARASAQELPSKQYGAWVEKNCGWHYLYGLAGNDP